MASYLPLPESTALLSAGVVAGPDSCLAAELSVDARIHGGIDRHRDPDGGLHARLVAAQEAERARIARELHDVVGQALTAVRLNLLSLDRVHARTGASGAAIFDSIAAVDIALAQVRTAAFDLRPAVLDDIGLGAALRALCRQVSRRSGVAVSCRIATGTEWLPTEIGTTCFRVAQEAITNAVRHARARRVSVHLSLRRRSGTLVLQVADDGVGFDPSGCEAMVCLGIAGMAERASMVDGAVEVRSRIGVGTQVIATFGVGRPLRLAG